MKIAIIAWALAAASSAASASTLNPATYHVQIINQNGLVMSKYTAPGDYNYSPMDVSIVGGPVPSVSANVFSDAGSPALFGDGGGVLTYYIEYSGARDETLQIDMDVKGNVSASGPNGSATAGIDFAGNTLWFCATYSCTQQSIDQTFSFAISSNTQYQVDMSATVSADSRTTVNTGHAYVDPFFYLDPSQTDASDFTLLTSDGVSNGNPAAAPEPATLAVAGLGLALLSLRRRIAS